MPEKYDSYHLLGFSSFMLCPAVSSPEIQFPGLPKNAPVLKRLYLPCSGPPFRPVFARDCISSGDGRTRTAVQTPHPKAFYTLIPSLVVGPGLPEDRRTGPYPLGLEGF